MCLACLAGLDPDCRSLAEWMPMGSLPSSSPLKNVCGSCSSRNICRARRVLIRFHQYLLLGNAWIAHFVEYHGTAVPKSSLGVGIASKITRNHFTPPRASSFSIMIAISHAGECCVVGPKLGKFQASDS
ncbi:hypothetical protein IAQ61_007712 [Plenodomus lingam]|uniref:uncharacterized protein n=1 Tax=Leptosphaeria maculans TaxID=5022 RepID=UPI003319CA77|nr:hypothetical protein IAQ61_007712 [Plenodomus lingam]